MESPCHRLSTIATAAGVVVAAGVEAGVPILGAVTGNAARKHLLLEVPHCPFAVRGRATAYWSGSVCKSCFATSHGKEAYQPHPSKVYWHLRFFGCQYVPVAAATVAVSSYAPCWHLIHLDCYCFLRLLHPMKRFASEAIRQAPQNLKASCSGSMIAGVERIASVT